ncbi:MAG: hypothetical protein AAGB00_04910 [Planctomycetota bacterium]
MNALLAQSIENAPDAVWRLDATWRYTPWLTVLAVAGFIALVAYCYARELSPAGRPYRWLLALLRLTTITLLMAMLSELLIAGSRSGRPRFAVLVDVSASMGVADGRGAAAGGDDGLTRLRVATAALSSEQLTLVTRLSQEFDVDLYRLATRLDPLEAGEAGWAAQLAELAPDESAPATRLGDGIHDVLQAAGGPAPQGVLVVSDGRVTAGRPLAAAAETARRASAPLYFLGVGGREAPPDVALADLLAEEVVFVDDLVSFRATLRTTAAVTEPVRVALKREGSDRVLAEQMIKPPAGGGATPVQLIHRPDQPGGYRYVLSASPVEAELNRANNAATHALAVRDQEVRVLLAAGGPSYEYRYLKHLLERDSTVALDSFLQEADPDYASADPSAVSRLPLREEELDAYDAVVVMDLDPRLTPRTFWPALRGFVAERGGGLALVAGERSLPGAYRDVADFAALYPAELPAGGEAAGAGAGFRLAPTPVGLQRAALQLSDDAASTGLAWRALPPLYWHAEVGKLKPAAQVLATHPSATGADGGPAPLIVSQYFGAGQVVLHAVDSTYRWRRRTGDVYFARYWVQTLRSLARGRLAAGEGGAELCVDRTRYAPGESIRLRLSATGAGDSVTVLLETEDGPQQRVALTPSSDARGVYQATLDRLPVGRYRAVAADASGGEVAAEFEIVAPPGEFARLEMAAAEMQAAAERCGGRFFTVDQVDELAEALPAARRVAIESLPPIELWNRWWMLAAVCGCLSTEWVLRKRRAML